MSDPRRADGVSEGGASLRRGGGRAGLAASHPAAERPGTPSARGGSTDRQFPAAVVQRAVHGDRAAFGTVYEAHYGLVYWLANRILGSATDAEDIAQETFARALANIGDYEQRDDIPISAWLCRIARNLAISDIRSRQRIAGDHPPQNYRPRDHEFDHADARLDTYFATRHVVRRMPDDWRRVVRMKFAGARNDEIAAAMGRTEDQVKGLYHRCLTALRENAA